LYELSSPAQPLGQVRRFSGFVFVTRWSSLEQIWDNRRMLHRACPYPHEEVRVFHGNRIGGDESEAALNVDDPLPGLEQLQHALERLDANPELQHNELQLRAHFDEQMFILPQQQQHGSSKL
jgi:hypothetical protein